MENLVLLKKQRILSLNSNKLMSLRRRKRNLTAVLIIIFKIVNPSWTVSLLSVSKRRREMAACINYLKSFTVRLKEVMDKGKKKIMIIIISKRRM